MLEGDGVELRLGLGVYGEHTASLAGTRGVLVEVGSYRVGWSFGRAAVELAGTFFRAYRGDSTFAGPVGGVRVPDGGVRQDAGDHRLSTLVRLTDGDRPWDLALRFGVRLPTTDERAGLERDRTDFFTTVAVRGVMGPIAATAEVGMGILGTRDPAHDQVDPLLYATRVSWTDGWLRPHFEVVGQHDTRSAPAHRGNEDLGELRVGVTGGNGRWFRVSLVRGFRPFSPSFGVTAEVGIGH